MAKKKNQSKKHRFKYADPAAAAVGTEAARTNGSADSVTARVRQAAAGGPTREFSYVSRDLRRIAVLAAVLVAVEVALWLLFSHSGVGNQVYNLVKV